MRKAPFVIFIATMLAFLAVAGCGGGGGGSPAPAPVAIAGRTTYSLMLKTDGTVWAWGLFYDTRSYVPSQVLKLSNITAIAAGSNHALALKGN